MAKVSFTKLGLKVNKNIEQITFNDQTIEIKQYLPVNTKLELISNIINNSADEYNFANPVKINIFMLLEIFYNYTNINFTDKQKEDVANLYDLLVSSGLAEAVLDKIPEEEYNEIIDGLWDSINSIYSYKNSVMGILDNVSKDYSNLNLDATDIQQKLADPDNMDLLRNILTRLG